MMLSSQLQRLLAEGLRSQPLMPDEVRRVEGMGNLYVSLQRRPQGNFYFRYTLEVDTVDHHFFSEED